MLYPQKARLLILVNASLALTLLAIFFLSPEARASRTSRARLLYVAPGEIWTVEIRDPSQALVFQRFGGTWIQDSGSERFPARSERVEAFLDAVASVRSLRETARSEAAWESLGLEDISARRVLLKTKDGKTVSDFRIGRYSPDGAFVYIRRDGKAVSYSAVSALSSRLPSERRAWLDLRIFGEPVPLEDVQSLRVAGSLTYAEGATYRADYTLTRDPARGWASTEIPDLDGAAAQRFIRALLYAEAEDFVGSGPTSVAQPGLRLDVELGSGTLRTLWMDSKPDGSGGFLAARTGAGRSMRVAAWTLKNLLKSRDELRNKRVP